MILFSTRRARQEGAVFLGTPCALGTASPRGRYLLWGRYRSGNPLFPRFPHGPYASSYNPVYPVKDNLTSLQYFLVGSAPVARVKLQSRTEPRTSVTPQTTAVQVAITKFMSRFSAPPYQAHVLNNFRSPTTPPPSN